MGFGDWEDLLHMCVQNRVKCSMRFKMKECLVLDIVSCISVFCIFLFHDDFLILLLVNMESFYEKKGNRIIFFFHSKSINKPGQTIIFHILNRLNNCLHSPQEMKKKNNYSKL